MGALRLIGEMNLVNFASSSIKDRGLLRRLRVSILQELEKVIIGDKEKFKKYLKKGFNPQIKTHVASMPIKDMYSANLPTLITDRERKKGS